MVYRSDATHSSTGDSSSRRARLHSARELEQEKGDAKDYAHMIVNLFYKGFLEIHEGTANKYYL